MDSNTLYVATMVGRQDAYNDAIVVDVWKEEGFGNMSEEKAQDACEDAYEKHGASVYAKCRAAGVSCGSDSDCDVIFAKYAKALAKNYKGSFEDFKKRSSNLASAGQLSMEWAGKILSGLGGGQGAGQEIDAGFCAMYPDDVACAGAKKRTGLYVAIGILALGAIGTAIYFATKK